MRRVARSLAFLAALIPSAAFAQISDDPVALPPEPNQAFRLPSTARAIRLPVEISSRHGVFVQARLNDSQPLWFLLDSAGGSPLIIDSRRAAELKLPMDGKGRGLGTGENPFDVIYTDGVSIRLAGLEMNDQTVAATSLETLQRYAGRSLDGIFGFELFSRFVVEVHYAAGNVYLYDPATYRYDGSGQMLPISLEGKQFCVRARITFDGAEPVEAKLLVDTGAGEILTALNRPFVDQHHLLPPKWASAPSRLHAGLGGETRVFSAHARAFELGHFVFHDLPVDLSRDSRGLLASEQFDGLLGGELLRRFRVIFDYSRQRMILEPNTQIAGL